MTLDHRLVVPVLLTCIGGGLIIVALAYGGYWAAALAIGGPKYGDYLRPVLGAGAILGGAGAGILATAQAYRRPQAR